MDNVEDAKQRVIAAALRVAAAERGGLDQVNAAAEVENAAAVLEQALTEYVELATAEA